MCGQMIVIIIYVEDGESRIFMEDHFKFLLTMPIRLNAEIESVSLHLHQSKSSFIRDAIRQHLVGLNKAGVEDKENSIHRHRHLRSRRKLQLPVGVWVLILTTIIVCFVAAFILL